MNLAKINPILDKVLFCLVLLLFAFIPLYPKFPLINVSGTFVAIRLEDVFIAVAVGIWLVYLFINKKWDFFTKDIVGKAMLVFFVIGLFSLFSAFFLTHTASFNLGTLHFFRRVELMLLLPICVTSITNRKRFIFILTILFLTLLIVNSYALGQRYLDWPVISTTNSEFSKGLILRLTPGARVNSTFAGHYDFAIFLSAALIYLTVFFFAVGKFKKLILLILGGLSLFILIMTAARVSFVTAFIGLMAALIFARRKKYLILLAVCLVITLIYPSQLRDRFIFTITVNVLNLGHRYEGRNLNQQLENKLNIPTIYYRMASRSAGAAPFATASGGLPVDIAPGEPTNVTQLDVYRSFQIRFNTEWPMAIRAFTKNPFFGLGYSSLGLATDNDFLRSLGEVGLLGTLAFLLVVLSIWKKIYQGIKKHDQLVKFFSAGSLSLIVAFLLNGLFIDVFEASKVASLFWMVLGLNLAVLNWENKKV